MAVVANEIERRYAVVVASNRLPIDDAGARAQASQRLNDQREAAGEVIAGTAIEPHPFTIFAGVLNLMQPRAADGSVWALVGRHGAMKPVGTVRGRASMMRA